MVVAFRSDGTKSHTVYPPDGSLPMVQIADPKKLEYRVQDSATKKWHAMTMNAGQAAFDLRLYKRCEDQFYDSGLPVRCEPMPDKMLGFEVWKVSYVIPPNASGATMERELWVSPELNWYPLIRKAIVNGKLEALEEVKQVRLGEPDASLFAMAPDYQQLDKPSEFLAEAETARGRQPTGNSKGAEMLDAKPRPPCLGCKQ